MANVVSDIVDGLDILHSLREQGPVMGSGANALIPQIHGELLGNIRTWLSEGTPNDDVVLKRVKNYLNDLASKKHPEAMEILNKLF